MFLGRVYYVALGPSSLCGDYTSTDELGLLVHKRRALLLVRPGLFYQSTEMVHISISSGMQGSLIIFQTNADEYCFFKMFLGRVYYVALGPSSLCGDYTSTDELGLLVHKRRALLLVRPGLFYQSTEMVHISISSGMQGSLIIFQTNADEYCFLRCF